VKGFAPLLLDVPGERDGEPVLWCWLEGDEDIAWYHRPTPDLPAADRCERAPARSPSRP
jgi:hypothetical protein